MSIKLYADGDSVVDEVQVTVDTGCTMGGMVNTAHTTSLTAGTYSGANGIGKTTLTTYCNDYNGFSIYAIGYTGDVDGGNTLVGASSGETISTGVYSSGASTSSWSMKVTKVTDSTVAYNPENMSITNSYDSYHAVPSDYAKVAEYKASAGSSTTDTTLGAKVETTYDTYISTTQTADNYTGQVKYVMVHPYNASAPEKETPTPPSSFSWQESSATKPADEDVTATFQSFDSATCNLGTTGQIGWLKDSRDNQVYKIAKLADGKCWMVENLNIAGGTALSADNTDVTSAYISSFSTSNNLTKTGDTIVLPTSSTSGFDIANYSYVYNSGNKTNCGGSGQNNPCYSYYSWDAATLGSGRTIATENTDAEYSICPKGWRLPASGGYLNNEWKRGDFYALATAYGSNLETETYEDSTSFYNNAGPNTVPNFLLGGNCYDGGPGDEGAVGSYWSSTSQSDAGYARDLYFNDSGYVDSASGYGRYYGLSVRCLLSGQ